jgi:hypothetical protein
MTTQEPTDTSQEPENYRGDLVYLQEHGRKLVVISVTVTSDERSYVISHVDDLPLAEEEVRFPGFDSYFFRIPDDARLHLIIESPAGSKDAWYTLTPDEVIAHPSPLTLDITGGDGSIPPEYAYSQEAFDEALRSFGDEILYWLDAKPWQR